MLCKRCTLKLLKNSIKPLASLFLVRFQTFFTRRVLKGKMGIQKALQEHLHTRALKAFEELGNETLEVLGHLKCTYGTWAIRYLSIWALEKPLGTPGLRHLNTWAIEALETLF